MNASQQISQPRARGICRAAILGLGATFAFVACGGGNKQARPQPVVPVLTAKVEQKVMPIELRAIGHVEPISTVGVRARIGGDLNKVSFSEGQPVRAGDTLFSIDARPYEATLRQTEAQLAKDQAMLKKAEADISRYADLVRQDFVTKEQFDQINANADALKAAVAADQANIDNARLQVQYCTIKAPVSGRTGNVNVKVGNLVKANDDKPLVTINQTRPIYATFSVPAQFLPAITAHKADAVKVAAALPEDGGTPHEGKLTFVDNSVDETTSTIMLKATFANEDEGLWPGQFVTVVVTLGQEAKRLVVPSPAVQSSQQGQFVYVVKDDQTAELRPVKVNRMDEKEAVIESGVSAGEIVVTDGQLRLVPGVKVQLRDTLGAEPEKRP